MKPAWIILVAVNACSWGRVKEVSQNTFGKIRNGTISTIEYIGNESPVLWEATKNATIDAVEDIKVKSPEFLDKIGDKTSSIAAKARNNTLDSWRYVENQAETVPWKRVGYTFAGLLIGALVGVFSLLEVGVALTLFGFTVDGVLALSFAAMCQSYCYGAATGLI